MNDELLLQKFIEKCVDPADTRISPGKISQARLVAKWSNEDFYEVLLNLQLVSLSELNEILQMASGYPAADPLTESYKRRFPQVVLDKISKKAAVAHKVFPMQIARGELHLVMANPTDEKISQSLEKMAGLPIVRYVCHPKIIMKAVVRYYNLLDERSFENLINDALDEVGGKKKIEIQPSIWTEPLSQALNREIRLFPSDDISARPKEGEVATSMIVSRIIDKAIQAGASDIHLEPFENILKVRFRKEGILSSQWYIPNKLRKNVINRIKVLAGLDLTSYKRPQDGSISYENVLPVGVDIRVSVVPAMRGERVVLRLLDRYRGLLSPAVLGFDEDHLKIFNAKIKTPYGLILITGPTGSGKTTTIYAGLQMLNTESKCIITIEDPVEYDLKGINQIQINKKIDLDFSNAFRSILRQNPDVILLGEIRDNETAKVAVNASSTGHLVFSTLHTNDSVSAFPRLTGMGADPLVLAGTTQLVISQRLVRRLCPDCKKEIEVDEKLINEFVGEKKYTRGIRYFSNVGCPICEDTGYLGRIGIFEMLVPDVETQHLIINGAPSTELSKYAISKGTRSLKQDGMLKVKAGYISIYELIRVTGL